MNAVGGCVVLPLGADVVAEGSLGGVALPMVGPGRWSYRYPINAPSAKRAVAEVSHAGQVG